MLVLVRHLRRRRGGLHTFGIALCLGAVAALAAADVARAQTQRGGSGGRLQMLGIDELFAQYDKDGDGKLTAREVPAERWRIVGRADANSDAAVSRAEVTRFRQSRGPQQSGKKPAPLGVPDLDDIQRVDRAHPPTGRDRQTSTYILRTQPHPVTGKGYLVVTDHTEKTYLAAMQRLARHRNGRVLKLADLRAATGTDAGRTRLREAIRKENPRYVAIAPRLESYRENVLLGMWDTLASLDADRQLDVLPGLLIAPDAESFAALIDRSIAFRTPPKDALRPFTLCQISSQSVTGMRSLQKIHILRNLFAEHGCKTPSLIIRTPGTDAAAGDGLDAADIWQASMPGRGRFLPKFPAPAKEALDRSSLLVMFGHGAPGMVCAMSTDAFHDIDLGGKVVLCGSCFSCAALQSDFPAQRRGPDGSEIRNDRERFVLRAVKQGAVVVHGHMRLNGGFPHLHPVLESFLAGQTVGEASQRLINALIEFTPPQPGAFTLPPDQATDRRAQGLRNNLLYVLVGDPALTPLPVLTTEKPTTK